MQQTLELYHKALLKHAAAAVGHGRLQDADATVRLNNPLCGDRVTVDLRLDDGRIEALAHEVRACALCQASMSLLAEQAPGKDKAAIESASKATADYLEGGSGPFPPEWESMRVFEPVRPHKSRYRCVMMPFEAVLQAIDEAQRTAEGGAEGGASP